MRLMFYGLQNSGATLVTLFAGQRPASVVIPDLWTMYCAPEIGGSADICIKVTVTSSFPLRRHLEAFRPDAAFMVVRRPVDNIVSLRRKHFARHDGTPAEKFATADRHFASPDPFDGVVAFEDFVSAPGVLARKLEELGWDLPDDAGTFPRTPLEIERHNWREMPDLYHRAQWGTGQARIQSLNQLRLGAVEDEQASAFCERHCPAMHEHYEQRQALASVPPPVPLRHSAQDEPAFQAQQNYVLNHLALFESHIRLGNHQAALELAEEMSNLAPDRPETWRARARALGLCGRHEEAESLLLHALQESAPQSTKALGIKNALAASALRDGDVERCTELAREVIACDPRNVPAQQLLADSALKEGRFADAISHAEAVINMDSANVGGRRALGEGLLGVGRISEAREWLESCSALAPDNQLVRRKLEQVREAEGGQAGPDVRTP